MAWCARPGAARRREANPALRPNATARPVTPVTLILHKPTGYDANLDGPQPALALITAPNRVADDRSDSAFSAPPERAESAVPARLSLQHGLRV